MTIADMVNLIVEKLGVRAKFDSIDVSPHGSPVIHITFAHNRYVVISAPQNHLQQFDVLVRRLESRNATVDDNYSRWIQGCLNGLVRNEKGEMVQP